MKQNSSNHLHSTNNSNCISDSPLFGWLVAFFTQSFASQTSMTKLISAMKVCWYGKVTVFCRHTWCCSMAGRQMRKVSSKTCLALLTHQLCGINGAHQVSMATPSNRDLQTWWPTAHVEQAQVCLKIPVQTFMQFSVANQDYAEFTQTSCSCFCHSWPTKRSTETWQGPRGTNAPSGLQNGFLQFWLWSLLTISEIIILLVFYTFPCFPNPVVVFHL